MIPTELLIEKGAVSKKVEAGEVLYAEHAPSTFYYQVISGRIRICNFLDDGKEVLHKVIDQTEGFGEVAIIDGGPHVVSAVADCPSILLKISAQSFLEILKEYNSINLLVTQQIARDLRFKMFLTRLIWSHNPEEILVGLIKRLNDDRKLICPECNRLMLTRQQLANMTGLRVETIIRTMKVLEKQDKLTIVKGKVFVPSDGIGEIQYDTLKCS